MPGNATHDRIGLFTSVPIAVAAAAATNDWHFGLAAFCGHVFGTLYLSPDLDLGSASIDDRWGPLKWMWIPYDRAIHHRSRWSHSGVSVFLRVAYVALAFWLFTLGLDAIGIKQASHIWPLIQVWMNLHPRETIGVALGLFSSDSIHSFTDKVSTESKKASHDRIKYRH